MKEQFRNSFDIVISQNSIEHFRDPQNILNTMKDLLKPGGRIMIIFGPPWYAPYGSHMHYFTKIPWVNIIFSEKTVMNVRAHFRNDGATKYEDVESGLNKMSVRRFEKIIESSKTKVYSKRYRCVKGLNFLSYAPFLRELFINQIDCVLVKY